MEVPPPPPRGGSSPSTRPPAARVGAFVTGALDRRRDRRNALPATNLWVDRTATTVLAVVQSSRAVWQEPHVRAETERRARADGIAYRDLDRAVNAVVAEALSPRRSVALDSTDLAA